MGIKHIEDLKLDQILDFCSSWAEDNSSFEITEKFDGNFFSLGINSGTLFMSSKSKVFKTLEEIPEIFYFDDFRKYFKEITKSDFAAIAKNVVGSKNFSISGELIASPTQNVIQYSKDKVSSGVCMIFKYVNLEQTEIEEIFSKVNKKSKVKFINVPAMDLPPVTLDNQIIDRLKKINDDYSELLAKPARNALSKALKKKVLSEVKEVSKELKKPFLAAVSGSMLGDEIEGLVFKDKAKNITFKIIDKTKFLAKNKIERHYMNKLKDVEKDFYTKKEINGLSKDLLKAWHHDIVEIERNFKKNGKLFVTLDKKVWETEQTIKMTKEKYLKEVEEWHKGEKTNLLSFMSKLTLKYLGF
jgi:hypothetical protein